MTDVTINFEGEDLSSPWLPVEGTAPAVLVLPTVMGVSELEIEFAGRLNALGYHAMVGDLFGTATRGNDLQAMFGELGRLKGDRAALRRRLQALYQEAVGHLNRGRADLARGAVDTLARALPQSMEVQYLVRWTAVIAFQWAASRAPDSIPTSCLRRTRRK